jgi:hypothetical protein
MHLASAVVEVGNLFEVESGGLQGYLFLASMKTK